MDLAEIFRVMRRRWYVLLPGLLLTVALTVGAYVKVPVTYQSQSTVVLLNSQKATVAFDGNPYLSTQLSLNGMADSLARNLNSDAAITHLKSQGATSTTVAKLADNALGPLLWLTTTGTDKHAVLTDDKLLTTYAEERLNQFQTDQAVKPQAMIRMATIVPPQNPVAQTKTRYEYLIAAGLLGIVVSMVGTFYVEARSRTGAQSQPGTQSQSRAAVGEPKEREEPGEPGDAADPGEREEDGQRPVTARHAPRWSMPGARDSETSSLDTVGPAPADAEAADTEAHRFV
ncbi:MAG: hypothetical protein QOF98_1457 [Streptomyces sp.]|nr:hypothetical protein [Streptomyces sp.]